MRRGVDFWKWFEYTVSQLGDPNDRITLWDDSVIMKIFGKRFWDDGEEKEEKEEKGTPFTTEDAQMLLKTANEAELEDPVKYGPEKRDAHLYHPNAQAQFYSLMGINVDFSSDAKVDYTLLTEEIGIRVLGEGLRRREFKKDWRRVVRLL
ncbi:hypothetical protein HDV00_002295 [Rhizophlyctis rosea]|nr:hypothetical protein HDV00_002295 [Rhizophlyctis rosea]